MTTRLNRRDALKSMAAAAAAPYVITSTALGNDQTPPASDRVTLGHIGVGGQGRGLLGALLRCEGAQSVAAADPYADRRDAVANLIKGTAYGDFRELLARDDIDAVVVATPDHWHVPVAIAAARAGKDCYVEKPLGLTVEENLACRRVFQEHGRIFQYGTQQRSQPHCRFYCSLVASGKIGKIKALEVVAPNGGAGGSTQEVPVPANLDYNMWVGPAPMKPYTADRCKTPGTYWIYDYSIGYLAGWGAHPLDLMVWGCDCDLAGPMTFEGTGKVPTEGLYDTVYDWDVNIQMAGEVTMSFKPGPDYTRFIGEDGWVGVARDPNRSSAYPESLNSLKLTPEEMLPGGRGHYQNFVDCVKSRQTAISDLPQAVRSDNISQLSDIAVRLGRKVVWDPTKEEILDDAEATKMLARPLREPWTL
jgi:glucose-fructose oxidoreductase